MWQTRGTEGHRCHAGIADRQPGSGPDRLVALRPWHHDQPDRGDLQLSPTDEGDTGRHGSDMASSGRVVVCLVPENSAGGVEIGCAARRRDGLAGKWKAPFGSGAFRLKI